MRVRKLPDELIDRIAAGEVVERPAAVVKELVENALDADARSVTVTLEGGGLDRISVRDDGVGMDEADARLALERHATSKLRSDEDLFNIRTMGFRGEALPSIASVSRFALETCTRGAASGVRLRVDGGGTASAEPAPPVPGTQVDVLDLFHNVPARLKFLKTPRTEAARCLDAVKRLALVRPDVAFTVIRDGKTVLDAFAVKDLAARAIQVLGSKHDGRLVPFEAEGSMMSVFGLASTPEHHLGSASHLFLFVNGRPVRDPVMLKALREAYAGLLPRGRHPVVLAYLEVPPDRVDVNVHPAKTEVRFLDSGMIFRLLRRAVEETWKGSSSWGMGKQLSMDPASAESGEAWTGVSSAPTPSGRDSAQFGLFGPEPLASVIHDAPLLERPPDAASIGRRAEAEPREARAEDRPLEPDPAADAPAPGFEPAAPGSSSASAGASTSGGVQPPPELPPRFRAGPPGAPAGLSFAAARILGIWNNAVLLCQAGGDLVLIDRHRAHERILFDRFAASVTGAGARGQMLLLPRVIELPPTAKARLLSIRELLHRVGFELDDFGGGSIAVKALPADLPDSRAEALLLAASESVDPASPDAPFALASLAACHSAARPGEPMGGDLLRTLLGELDRVDRRSACPHGRPWAVRFGPEQVERWFRPDP